MAEPKNHRNPFHFQFSNVPEKKLQKKIPEKKLYNGLTTIAFYLLEKSSLQYALIKISYKNRKLIKKGGFVRSINLGNKNEVFLGI